MTYKGRFYLHIVQDEHELASAAVDLVASTVGRALQVKDSFFLAIPGGITPQPFYQMLATDSRTADLPWERISIFWTDERYVSHEHPDSNYGLAARTFLLRVGARVYPVPTDLGSPCQTVRAYQKTLSSVFGLRCGQVPAFDLVILGMGTDGHIASLMPYCYALVEDLGPVCIVWRPDGSCRISLTGQVIVAAARIVLLISGHEKAKILTEVLKQRPNPLRYPVHILWPVLDKVIWLFDAQAASPFGC